MNKKKDYYSFSQLNTFNNCPQKYKLLYIDNIKKKDESIEGYLGKTVHEVLEWIYNNKFEYCVWDKIENKYEELWDKNWHCDIYISIIKRQYNKNHFKKIGLECLRNYYKNQGGPYLKYDHIISTEVVVETRIGKYKFKGIIDRLDENEDSINIHDYKTGKPKSQLMMNKDLQLVIYLLAIQKKRKTKKIILNWHFLKHAKVQKQHIRVTKNQTEIEKNKEDVIKNVEQIVKAKKNKDFPPNENFLCNWCYLWEYCESKKQYNEINPSINAS